MKTTVWTIEFAAPSIATAIDIARQHTPAGNPVPSVQRQGRMGYEIITSDYALAEAIRAHVGHENAIIGKR